MSDFIAYNARDLHGSTQVEMRRWTLGKGWHDAHPFREPVIFHGGATPRQIERWMRRTWTGKIFPADHAIVAIAGNPWRETNDAESA